MQSFYGGPPGQSFEIKQVFESYYGPNGAQSDLEKGWSSSILVGEFVMVSYGLPTDENYDTNQGYDLAAGKKKNLNSTLWQKVYDESAKEGSGLSYKLISSCTGNTPKINIIKPSIVLHANEQPDVETDLTNPDTPQIQFKLPRSQVLSMPEEATILDADQMPSVEYNDNDIDNPTLHFNIPQSQVIDKVETTTVIAGTEPSAELDTTDINRPTLKFQLPVSQEFLDSNILSETLDANQEPSVNFKYDEADALHANPILTFYLPQSQVMDEPETITVAPGSNPQVTDIGSINAPKLQFELPRAVKFYYGTLLGERTAKTYTLSGSLLADYQVGDYYINESTGFIYKITEKTNDTTCVFEYQATIQQPLPSIITSSLSPYTQSGESYIPAAPQVIRTFTNSEGTAWKLEFKLPQAPKPEVTSSFVGSMEEGAASVMATSADTVTFDFKIPTGSKLFTGLEINQDGSSVSIDGARIGDLYLNSDTGVIYTLIENGWKASEKSIKGPVGDALSIEATYFLTETESYEASLSNGAAYIEEHYSGTISPQKIFAVIWTLLEDNAEISYWYFKTNEGVWARTQLTGGISNLLESTYKENIDNKAYSVNYINTLIGGEEVNIDKTAYSKQQVQELLSWGSFQDLINKG